VKIGVISDTHIPDRSKVIPDEILQAFKGADMLIHAGDLVDLNVLRQLKSICPNVKAVYGNMDPHEVRKELPEKEIIKAGNYKIGVMHGNGPAVKLIDYLSEAFKNDDVDIIIFGHSHSGFNEKIGKILFFNPGSATDKVFASYNSYGIIEINGQIEAKIIKL
jgi:putative phosphoesterase